LSVLAIPAPAGVLQKVHKRPSPQDPLAGNTSKQPDKELFDKAMAAMKEIGSKFITTCVDQVATVAKDVEAFSMIDEAVTILLWFLDGQIAGIVAKAAGGGGQMGGFERISQAAEAQFSDRRRDLQRQLEIQRFTFTVPQQPLAATPSPPPPAVSKGRGGKPLAAHWDEMWAAIAVMLYTGDLQPKTQADIERSMKDWLAGHDLDVGDTAIRDRARRLSVRFQEAE